MFKGNERKKVQNKDIIKHDGKTILNGTSVRRLPEWGSAKLEKIVAQKVLKICRN